MYDLNQLIMMGREEKASDLHISAGMPLMMRVHGKLEQTLVQPDEQETEVMLYGLLDENQKTRLAEGYDIDLPWRHPTTTGRGSMFSGSRERLPPRSVC